MAFNVEIEKFSVVWIANHLPLDVRFTFYIDLFNKLGQVTDKDTTVVRKRVAILIFNHFNSEKYYQDERFLKTVDSYAHLSKNNSYHLVMQKFHEQKPYIRTWSFYRMWAQTLFDNKCPAKELDFVKEAAFKHCFSNITEVIKFFSQLDSSRSIQDDSSGASVATKSTALISEPFVVQQNVPHALVSGTPANQEVHLTGPLLFGSHQEHVSTSPCLSVVDEETASRISANPISASDLFASREPITLPTVSFASKTVTESVEISKAKSVGSTGGVKSPPSSALLVDSSTPSSTNVVNYVPPKERTSPPGFDDNLCDSLGQRLTDYGFGEQDEKPHVAEHSFTTRIYQNNYNAFGNTLPFSQEKLEKKAITSDLSNVRNPGGDGMPTITDSDDSFSVYCDSLSTYDTKEKEKSLIRPFTKDATIRGSPIAKRNKFSDDSLDEEVNLMSADLRTVAGLGTMGGVASSTPVGPSRLNFGFPDNETAIFPLAKMSKDEKKPPFKFAPDPVAEPRSECRRSEHHPFMDVEVKEDISTQPSNAPAVSPKKNVQDQNVQQFLDDLNLDDTTHNSAILPLTKMQGGINPWSDQTRASILERFVPLVAMHEMNTVAPIIKIGQQTDLGGEKYTIHKIIGQGAFARVYLGECLEAREKDALVAMKHESPACPWEVYICYQLKRRVCNEGHPLLMIVHDSYIYTNASIIVYDFHPYGTVLDLVNNFRRNNQNIDSVTTGLIALQLSHALNYVHNAKIIHSDVKPDNIIITNLLDNTYRQNTPFIKLIDWGRSIDMLAFPDQQFTGRAGTDGFDCIEMKSNRPWTYQTDFYGWAATVHVIVLNSYMSTYVVKGKNVPVQTFRRRNHFHDIFTKAVYDFLNIPSCEELPDWSVYIKYMKARLDEIVNDDPASWITAVDRVNRFLKKEETDKKSSD